jgi:hypothetical protein
MNRPQIPADGGQLDRPSPMVDMPMPRQIGERGAGVGAGPATDEATAHVNQPPPPTPAVSPSGSVLVERDNATPASPVPVRTPRDPQ